MVHIRMIVIWKKGHLQILKPYAQKRPKLSLLNSELWNSFTLKPYMLFNTKFFGMTLYTTCYTIYGIQCHMCNSVTYPFLTPMLGYIDD